LLTTFEELCAFELQFLGAIRKLERSMQLHMSDSFCSARKLKGLMISAGLERLGSSIARTLIDPRQDVRALLSFRVLLRSSRQLFEVLYDGLFEFHRDVDNSGDFASKNCEAEMLGCSEEIGSVFAMSALDSSLS